MTGVTRVLVADLRPGDEARPTRTGQPYTVAAVTTQHRTWTVRGGDGIDRHYPATAQLWRTDWCAGQGALYLTAAGAS